MAKNVDRLDPCQYTRDWPRGPFLSETDPIGAQAAAFVARVAGQIAYQKQFMGMSNRALAQKAGISLYTISRINTGTTWPRWDTLLPLCAVLEVRPTLVWDEAVEEPDVAGRVREVPYAPRPGRDE